MNISTYDRFIKDDFLKYDLLIIGIPLKIFTSFSSVILFKTDKQVQVGHDKQFYSKKASRDSQYLSFVSKEIDKRRPKSKQDQVQNAHLIDTKYS